MNKPIYSSSSYFLCNNGDSSIEVTTACSMIMMMTPIHLIHHGSNKSTLVVHSNHRRRGGRCKATPHHHPHHTATNFSSSASGIGIGGEAALFSLFLEMGIGSVKEINALLNHHEALKLAPFESIRTQIHSLENLGINGPLLSKLIRKRPNLLVSQEIHSLLFFLSNDLKGIIDPSQLARLLTAADPPTLLSGFDSKVRLLLDVGIPLDRLPHVLNNVNLAKSLCLKSCEDIQRMLSFLNTFGGVDLILRRPAILNFDMDSQLLPRIQFLLNLSGGDEVATTTVLLKLPFILAYTVDHYANHVDFFQSFAGLTSEEIFKIIAIYPSLFSASRERKLHPRIEFLKQCGFSSNDIYKLLIKAPLFLSLSFEDNLAHKLVLLVKIGYEHRTKELGLAMGWVCRSSCKNMQEVISLLLNYGLTCDEILAMGKKHPQVLQYNHKSMKQKLDYLTEEMGCEVKEMLAFPAFLGYGFDGRIKHRFEASGRFTGEGMSINKLFSMSTARFSKKQEKKLVATTESSR